MFLKQNTAVTILMGPALDSTDGVTPETALSPTVYVSKAGGAQAARSSAGAITHDRDGYYRVPLDATDTGTVGPLVAQFAASGALPVWMTYDVLPGAVYDALVAGSGNLSVAVASMGTDTLTAAALKADAVTEIQSGLMTAAGYTAPPTAAQVRTEMDANSTKLANLDATVSSRLAGASYTAPDNATITTIANAVDTEVAAIKAKTDNLPASPAAVGDIPSAASIASAVWSAVTRTLTSAGSGGATAEEVWGYASRTLSTAPPTASEIATAVWAATTRSLSTFGSLASSVASAVWGAGSRTLTSSSGGATAAEVWGYGSRTLTSSAGGVVGPGSASYPHSVTDPNGHPLDGVAVWVSTDAAGANVVAGTLYTDDAGTVTFLLDSGTYYVWKQRAGFQFENPEEVTVA